MHLDLGLVDTNFGPYFGNRFGLTRACVARFQNSVELNLRCIAGLGFASQRSGFVAVALALDCIAGLGFGHSHYWN